MRSMVEGVADTATPACGPTAEPQRPFLTPDGISNPLHHRFAAVPLPLRGRICMKVSP
jgi:hypothetical protein